MAAVEVTGPRPVVPVVVEPPPFNPERIRSTATVTARRNRAGAPYRAAPAFRLFRLRARDTPGFAGEPLGLGGSRVTPVRPA